MIVNVWRPPSNRNRSVASYWVSPAASFVASPTCCPASSKRPSGRCPPDLLVYLETAYADYLMAWYVWVFTAHKSPMFLRGKSVGDCRLGTRKYRILPRIIAMTDLRGERQQTVTAYHAQDKVKTAKPSRWDTRLLRPTAPARHRPPGYETDRGPAEGRREGGSTDHQGQEIGDSSPPEPHRVGG